MAYKFNKGAKKRKDFKTQDQYLDYIFEQNRGKLAEVFGANARERFKGAVESYLKVWLSLLMYMIQI